jgi:hypothetical protein
MTLVRSEIYDAFRAAGVPHDHACKAAGALYEQRRLSRDGPPSPPTRPDNKEPFIPDAHLRRSSVGRTTRGKSAVHCSLPVIRTGGGGKTTAPLVSQQPNIANREGTKTAAPSKNPDTGFFATVALAYQENKEHGHDGRHDHAHPPARS